MPDPLPTTTPAQRGAQAAAKMFGAPAQHQADPTAADPATTITETPAEEMISRAEAQKAFKARDAAKLESRRQGALLTAIATAAGIDVDALEVTPTSDPQNPFDVRGDALDKLITTAQTDAATILKRQDALKTKLAATATRASALEKWIHQTAGDGPIREALIAENAVHSGDGNYADLVAMIRPMVKLDIAIDEETGSPRVSAVALAADGTPLTDDKGNAKSVRAMVAEWLGARPQFRAARLARGPGAGGRGPAALAGPPALTAAERGARAARQMFGLPAPGEQANTPAERGRMAAQNVFGIDPRPKR